MIGVTVIAVGKIKEKYFTDAISEYAKRLSAYCRLNIIELKDEPIPENPSEREIATVLEKEGKRIIDKLPKSAYIIPLCIEGKSKSSVEFSDMLNKIASDGASEIVFIIGGSLGICDSIKTTADYKLSFSEMTFPHQLMRVILLEQVYRAFNISNGGKYHK